jgi:hypothetical protein
MCVQKDLVGNKLIVTNLRVQSSKCELLWIKVGLCVEENGSSSKRGAILESCEKGLGVCEGL